MVPDFSGVIYVNAPRANVLENLTEGWGSCANHVSVHSVHPANDRDPINTLDAADLRLFMAVYDEGEGCDSGRVVLTDLPEGFGSTTIEGLPAATNGPAIVWVGKNGVIVDAEAENPGVLALYRPLLNAIAQATKS